MSILVEDSAERHCWRCEGTVKGLFCDDCEAIQPPEHRLDHFERLGLPTRFAVDAAEVGTAHRALQRQVHPDRFASKSDRERRFSLEHSTALNDALRVLKDPASRAEYLLLKRGIDVASDAKPVQLSPMFLMEVIELREALAELVGSDAHVERGQLSLKIVAQYEALLAQLGAGLDADGATVELAQMAAQLRYLRRIIDELETLEDLI